MSEGGLIGAFVIAGAFDADLDAMTAEQMLERAGFSSDDISVVAKSDDDDKIKAAKGIVTGAAAGVALGGLAAALLLIPGAGPLLAAGPLALMMAGAGGLIGSFVGLGLTREEAQQYQELVNAGAEVMIVRASDEPQARQAAQILTDHGAHDVTVHAAQASS